MQIWLLSAIRPRQHFFVMALRTTRLPVSNWAAAAGARRLRLAGHNFIALERTTDVHARVSQPYGPAKKDALRVRDENGDRFIH